MQRPGRAEQQTESRKSPGWNTVACCLQGTVGNGVDEGDHGLCEGGNPSALSWVSGTGYLNFKFHKCTVNFEMAKLIYSNSVILNTYSI